MKKGLSVLLIVAALFGFYGGASSLTDVLACKDYWEKEGEKSTADMNKLEDGLNQLGENEQAYLDGLDQLADGEAQLAEGRATLAKGEADYAAAPGKLAAGRAAIAKGEKDLAAGAAKLSNGRATLKELKEKLATLEAGFAQWCEGYDKLKGIANTEYEPYGGFDALLTDGSLDPDKLDTFISRMKVGSNMKLEAQVKDGTALGAYNMAVNYLKSQGMTEAQAEATASGLGFATTYANTHNAGPIPAPGTPMDGKEAKGLVDAQIAATRCEFKADGSSLRSDLNKLIAADFGGQKAAFQESLSLLDSLESTPTLISGKKYMADELIKILDKVAGDEDNLKAIGGMTVIRAAKAGLKADDDTFRGTVKGLITKAQNLVKQNEAKLAQGQKEYNAGVKKLNAGRATYRQGLADYEAAPAKLAAGRQQLADGEKQLEEGKKQLAQYEDGEQQVRDGLATLMSTEPNGGLESILDRRGGDDEFDDANGHLDVQEGLDAVKVGRGYQADSGELITKEITNRAVGTAAGLGAAVLACLAALLSLIKKYKGAAVTAVLAAIAGVAGAVVGNGAGSEFSNIAGSTVGSLPWIAAGVVAAVACVFAIVNFTAKAE